MPLRIAHVVAVYPPYRGGMARVAQEYVERLRRRGHAVDVFTSRRDGSDPEPFVHRVRGLQIGNASIVPSLLYRLSGYDLVHLHYPFFGGAEFTVARHLWSRGQPLVLTYQMDATATGVRGVAFDLHRRFALPLEVGLADRILVSSADYLRISALNRLRHVTTRVEVHPLGVDVERFHPGDEPGIRRLFGGTPVETVLLFVGTLDAAHHFKGLPLLFEVLSTLRELPWRLVVVGDGPLRATFERRARALEIGPRVMFAAQVSDAALPQYYRAADVHVFPSTGRSEAYGLVVLEAAASGTPSIVSALPGVRTLVRNGETGWHVEPGDPAALHATLTRVISDPHERREFGRRARTRAEQEFAWEPLIDRLEETYAELLAAHRPP